MADDRRHKERVRELKRQIQEARRQADPEWAKELEEELQDLEESVRQEKIMGNYNFAKRMMASGQALAPTNPLDPPNEIDGWSTEQLACMGDGVAEAGTNPDTYSTPVEPDNAPALQPMQTLMARLTQTQLKMTELAKKTYAVLQKVVVDPALIEHGPNQTLYVPKNGRKYKVVQMEGKYFLDGTRV
jgi:hypothetical protein